jgi:hypothetical protein
MVDVEEIDDEGQPLRHDESKYVHQSPSLLDRIKPLFTCWRFCHMRFVRCHNRAQHS